METDDPVDRRFGRLHEKPCNRPETLTCALSACQFADECQAPKPPASRTNMTRLRQP